MTKSEVTLREILDRQTAEVADFVTALQVLYAKRYTGTVTVSFRYGQPKLLELAPTKIKLTGEPTTDA